MLKRQKISTRFLLHRTAPCLYQIPLKFVFHRSSPSSQNLLQSDPPPVDLFLRRRHSMTNCGRMVRESANCAMVTMKRLGNRRLFRMVTPTTSLSLKMAQMHLTTTNVATPHDEHDRRSRQGSIQLLCRYVRQSIYSRISNKRDSLFFVMYVVCEDQRQLTGLRLTVYARAGQQTRMLETSAGSVLQLVVDLRFSTDIA